MRVNDTVPLHLLRCVRLTRVPKIIMTDKLHKALNWALTNADVGMMLKLVASSGIDVDERDRACGMQTPLMRLCHMAISEEERSAVLLQLLDRDPDLNIKDSSGRTALIHASIAEKPTIVQYLSEIPHCDAAAKDNDGNTPLIHAVKSRQLPFVQTLLRIFCDRLDINARNNKGTTALEEADSKQDLDICQALITEGGAISTNLLSGSDLQSPSSIIPSFRPTASPFLSSTTSSIHVHRPAVLPPVVLSHRPQGAYEDTSIHARRVRSTKATNVTNHKLVPPISHGENLSNMTTTVLKALPQHNMKLHSSNYSYHRKEANSDLSSRNTKSKLSHPKNRSIVNTIKAQVDTEVDAHKMLVVTNGTSNNPCTNDIAKSPKPQIVLTQSPSRDETSSPVSLPKLSKDLTQVNSEQGSNNKTLKRIRKSSASLPNLVNTGGFLVTAQQGSTSSDNIAGTAAALAETKASEWERGMPSSIRKEKHDFKLPALDISHNNSLTTSDWCSDSSNMRLEGKRLSSKTKNRNSGNSSLERMLYSSAISVRGSRTFNSGD